MRVASCNYTIQALPNFEQYKSKITNLIQKMTNDGAELILLPEYAGVEIAGYQCSDQQLFKMITPLLPEYLMLFKQLAMHYKIYLQPGTIIVPANVTQYFNRAYFFTPNGEIFYQDKLQLVEYEKKSGLIARGHTQTVFNTPQGKIGIAICYDSEFPEIVRRLTYAGAVIILVPSYTTSTAGFHRVSISCAARALENQCYVVSAFVIGAVNVTTPAENTIGKATIYGPIDAGFSDNGIIIESNQNVEEYIIANLDVKKIERVRRKGQVHNFQDSDLLANEVIELKSK